MPVSIVTLNPAADDSNGQPELVDAPVVDVPVWLAKRRAQGSASVATKPLTQTVETPPIDGQPSVRSVARSNPRPPILVPPESGNPTTVLNGRTESWLTQQGIIGMMVSLFLHAVVLLVLACFLVSQVSHSEMVSIWGMTGETDEFGADLILNSVLPGDEGESAPIETTDASQILDAMGVQGDLSESMRVGLGGKGNGEGESGDGASVGVAALKIPGYAQTKGSFSTWANPRDPKPGEAYEIVIQIQLPEKIAKYRGSDISGNVIGTDSYRQVIRVKNPNELIPIEDGMVQIRIHVPGGGRLVRDTIRVESKMLREKQTFEIEF